jgi:hypothetical protein
MESKVGIIAKYIAIAMMVLALIFGALMIFVGDDYAGSFLQFSYLSLLIPVVLMVIFPIRYYITHPEKIKQALMSIGGLVAILAISYMLASGDELYFMGSEDFDMSESAMKRAGAGLIAFYIMAIGAIVAIAYSEISKLLK